MELLDRYLHAVMFWLPKGQEQDISAELSEELHSQIDERERELGRRLNEEELATILRQLGRPVAVASRYLPQQYLIGPALFPIYKLVLKIAGLCYVVPWALIYIGMMLAPGYRAEHHGQWLLGAVASLGYAVWFVAFVVTGMVTVVFAVLERVQAKSRLIEKWDPRKLPAVRVRNRISRVSSILDLVANGIFILWWVDPKSPALPGLDAIGFTMAPIWRLFFWGFLLHAAAHIALASANLRTTSWTRGRAAARLAIDAAGVILFCCLCRSQVFAQVRLAWVSPERVPAITQAANMWLGILFPYVVLVGLVVAAFDGYRLYRLRPTVGRMGQGLALGQ